MLRLWLAVMVGVALVVTSGVIASRAATPQPGVDPNAVINAYEAARSRQDMETALSYFADNATITQRNTTLTGKDEIRKYLDSISARSPYIVAADRHTSGNIVTWTERTATQQPAAPTARLPGYTGGQAAQGTTFTGRTGTGPGTPGTNSNTGTGTGSGITPQNGFLVTVEAVVQDGKIQSMSYVFGSQAPRPDPALEGRAQLPAGFGLAAVLAVLVGVLLIASVGPDRTTRVSSSLRGHLMQDLQGWSAARE